MKLRLLALALICAAGAAAQNPYVALQGATETSAGVEVSPARTILGVDVTAERDVTICGPYARYAQKFLGVRAPLADKTVWSVKNASVAVLGDAEYLAAPALAAPTQRALSHSESDEEFARIQPDKSSMLAPAPEDAAREAANTIFSLRKHRLELITGEAGEHVFGEGLKAALAEIARLEQSYLELFLGKRIISTEARRYVVFPQADKKQYIVCRFGATTGLLPETDLSGDLVVLQIDPTNAAISVPVAGVKESSFVACRVADPSICTVIFSGKEYGRTVLPIFEFGRTVNVPMPRRGR